MSDYQLANMAYQQQQQQQPPHQYPAPPYPGQNASLNTNMPPGQNPYPGFRPPTNPQQAAFIASMQRGPNGQPQWTPQQIQAAMQVMQSGQGPQAQALVQAAMARPPQQMQDGNGGGQPRPPPGMDQSAIAQVQRQQQQRIRDLQQQSSQASMSPLQGRSSTPNVGSPARPLPSQYPQQQGSMPPPPPPGSWGAPVPPHMQQQQQPPQLSFTPHQQQVFAAQRQNLINNPQYQSMSPQQQQAQMQGLQNNMIRAFAQQNASLQQQPPPQMQQQLPSTMQPTAQQQPPQRPESAQGGSGMNGSNQPPHQSPSGRQPSLPPMAQPPYSSLPQHMVPRPASAASQRAASPHPSQMGSPAVQHMASTPPPNQQMYPQHTGTPQNDGSVNAPSPSHSVHSHHSHHQTPQQHHQQTPQQHHQMPPSSASPRSMHSQTPSHMGNQQNPMQTPTHVGMNGGYQQNPPCQPGQPQIPPQRTPSNPNPAQAIHALQQHAQAAQTMISNGQLGGYPGGTPGQMPPVNPQQPPNPMNIMPNGSTPQNPNPNPQYQTPQPMPLPPPQGNPLPPNINISDFPFDWRLLPHIANIQNPSWREQVMKSQPALLAAVQNAAQMIASGQVSPEVQGRMRQVYLSVKANNERMMASGQVPGQVQGQGQGQGMGQAGLGLGRPPLQGVRQYSGGPPPLGGVRQGMGMGMGLPDSPSVNGGLPGLSGRPSSSKGRNDGTPNMGNMPPPTYIPSHLPSLPTPNRPSDHLPTPLPPNPALIIPIEAWRPHIPTDLPITSITPLPSSPTSTSLPDISEKERQEIKGWMESDKSYVRDMGGVKKRIQGKMMDWAKGSDMATPWWMVRKGENYRFEGRGVGGGVGGKKWIGLEEKREWRKGRSHRGKIGTRMEVRFSPKELKSMEDVEDMIIPIRLDLEHDQYKIKDTFMWNCADTVVTPELFARSLCDDFAVPSHLFVPRVIAAINEKVREYQDQVAPMMSKRDGREECRGKLGVVDDVVFGAARSGLAGELGRVKEVVGDGDDRSVKVEEGGDVYGFRRDGLDGDIEMNGLDGDAEDQKVDVKGEDGERAQGVSSVDERVMTVEEATSMIGIMQGEELRILVKVDIIAGTQNLSDTFEWDINSEVLPEEFAQLYCKELGLSGEFATAIAHDIHEQVLVHRRSLFLLGHTPNSRIPIDDELRTAFLPPLNEYTVVRREDLAMSSFTPIFSSHTEEDIQNLERERERDSRKKKRGGRARRGIILPDREPIKTHRTRLNPLGPNGLAPPPVEKEVVVIPTTTSRRAAAIAAQANIILINQDLPIPQPPSPVPVVVPVRAKKARAGVGRGVSRHSLEGSVAPEVVGMGTPLGWSGAGGVGSVGKREVTMVDEEPESPIPMVGAAGVGKRRNGRIVASPPVSAVEVDVKVENGLGGSGSGGGGGGVEGVKGGIGKEKSQWHCKNCGVPRHLTRDVRTDPVTGTLSLCGACGHFVIKQGRSRPCTYTEDEAYHLERVNRNKRKPRDVDPTKSGSAGQNPLDLPFSPSLSSGGDERFPPPVQNVQNERKVSVRGGDGSDLSSESSDDDEDDSDDDFELGRKKKAAKLSVNGNGGGNARTSVPAPTPASGLGGMITPARASVGLPQSTSPVKGRKPPVDTPAWMVRVYQELSSRYPSDDFEIAPKGVKPTDDPNAPPEWRVRCKDCPGKVYTLGPGETLNNFEVHLKNRQHQNARVANREKGLGGKGNPPV